jgi:hypothetical protein
MSYEGIHAVLAGQTETIAKFSVPSVRGIRVECVLHYVRSASVERICSHTMRPFRDERAPSRRVGQHVENRFTLWIAKHRVNGGQIKFVLESTGCVAENTWHSGRCQDDLAFTNACLLISGDVTEEVQEEDAAILFVAGNSVPFAVPSGEALPSTPRPYRVRVNNRITPTQFAEQNKGTFMLVTLRWYIADHDLE